VTAEKHGFEEFNFSYYYYYYTYQTNYTFEGPPFTEDDNQPSDKIPVIRTTLANHLTQARASSHLAAY
jgi:hypothetical protein